MADKKYIFFDIDGTLLPADGIVPDSTKKALSAAQENGHEIFINTGRCRNIVPAIFEELNFDGYVCGTGAYAEYHGKTIFNNCFSVDQARRVIKICDEVNIPIVMATKRESVTSSKDLPAFVKCFLGDAVKESDIAGMDDVENSPLLKSMQPIVLDDNKSVYYKKYKDISDFIYINSPYKVDEFNNMLGDDINVGKASFKNPDEYSGEITLGAYTKATGIKSLLEKLGADYKDSIAVGDGFNDADMIREASLSIAMGNSPQEIKELADYVTDDIYEDGIYNALKHFNLI